MKKLLTFILTLFTIHYSPLTCQGQEIPITTQQQLENQTDADQGELHAADGNQNRDG